MALTKKSLNNFLPNGFETQNKEGYKANFTNDRILSGYEKDTLEILSGPNLNNFIDKTGKNFNTLNDLLEYFNAMPIDSFPIVNASNQLDYKSINSFFRNVGELVFSSVPIDDKNLHLADGSLLDGKGTYRVFVDFIGKMATKYPNLFTDEATWQATVSKYGTCGKYVWNAENKTLRLPRLKGIVEATIDQNSIGNITEAGLPNITGTAQFSQEWESFGKYGYTGAFYLQQRKGNGVDGTRGNFDIVGFDASRSSQVYGKSNTVQPQTVKQYIYIVVSVDTEETTKLTSVFQYRGSVPTFADLPKEGNITGDVWNVDDTDVNYVWDGNEWDQLSGSVDLTGYYTKEQADTRFATVTSLESNVENLQEKITQNTTDIGSLGLGGLVASSLEKGKALKYLETKGNITEDADVYNDVYNYKHSTFDLSKFEVVGTPTITDDGVASGFSNINPLKVPFASNFNTLEIILPFNISQATNETQILLSSTDKIEALNDSPSIRIAVTTGRQLWTALASNDSFFASNAYSNKVLDYNVDYLLRFRFDGVQYLFDISSDNGKTYQNYITISSTLKFSNISNLWLGFVEGYTGAYWQAKYLTINLKQLSITVDGKEVFNGNKTGLDVIKPDNYTVVGSPTISEDGIATMSTELTQRTNYIQKSFDLQSLKNKNWKVECRFYNSNIDESLKTSSFNLFAIGLVKNSGVKYLPNQKRIDFGWSTGTAEEFLADRYREFLIKNDFDYVDIVYAYNATTKEYSFSYKTNNNEFSEVIVKPTTSDTNLYNINVISDNNKFFRIGGSYNNYDFVLPIDLNSFKIYVNDQLVYQPCLKIPYNISKTGLKVVNADARERVIGMGKDYGYSQYFTIDEENKNATLPIGAGITGRQDLIESFDDGTNKYEQFSDLTFKQSGKCTANTAVTFIQPYKDDDTYKLSVPYSAKTKTGFTPTVSGDWFAEGKIYLD